LGKPQTERPAEIRQEKRVSLTIMEIFIDRESSTPPFRQIKNRIMDLIESGEWKENQGIESVREISRSAGVSPATVQKAYIELKQEKVIYAKAGAGYFVTRQSPLSNNVFVFLPSSKLTFYTYILDGMFEANRSNDLNIQLYSLSTDKLAWNEQTADLLRIARRDHCSVIFIEEAFGGMRGECLKTAKKVPFVTIEWLLDHSISIVNDYRRAGFDMVDYCINRRRARSVVVLKGREKQYNARERLLGMQDAAQKFRLVEGRDIVYLDTDFDAISAYEMIKAQFSAPKQWDAVICANDYEAMGAIGAFLEKRILVGKDVVLIGFGNMIDSVTTYIPLTTIDQQLKLLGMRAISVIAEMQKGCALQERVITIPTRLIERMT
jgi:DNA-binding LacI/PurR family transcriptional regulator